MSRLDIRVYYEDTDAGGVMYHARYLAFAERARTEALRRAGATHDELATQFGLIFVVRRAEMDYLRPARLDDVVTVTTRTVAMGGASVSLRQEFAIGERVIGFCGSSSPASGRRMAARHGYRSVGAWRWRPWKRSRFVDRAVDATNLAAGALGGGDMSLLGLFLQADWVVKLVLLLLLAASVWVWAIVFEKALSLSRANRAARRFEDQFWSGGSLDELYRTEGEAPRHPMAAVFGAAMGEWQRSAQVVVTDMNRGSVRERVDRAIGVTVSREMDRIGAVDGVFGVGGGDGAIHRAVRDGVGDHAQLLGDRGQQEHEFECRGPGDCGGAVRDGDRAGGGDPCGVGLQ